MNDLRRWMQVVTEAQTAGAARYLYHGTSVAKGRAIIAHGFRLRGAKTNTFGKSISFSDKPIGTRHYDRGAILVFEFVPEVKVLSLNEFQRDGRGDADAVIGGVDPTYSDHEIAVFNPASIRWIGWYNKLSNAIDPQEPVYPKGFRHSWHSD